MNRHMTKTFALSAAALALMAGTALAEVELRMTWYDDGNEGAVMRDLLDRFEAENPDITVVMDTVPYTAVRDSLPVQLAAGEGPDLARVTLFGSLSEHFLDLTPYIEDPEYWESNFGPFLEWMRPPGDDSAISGFMTQLTVTGPYVNKTLFEQAGVEMPGEGATWDDWAAASKQVAEALDIALPMVWDRSGHRMSGPAISMGASIFDDEGNPVLNDEGMTMMAEKLVQWHEDGTMGKELWGSVSGSQYVAGNEEFTNAAAVLYMAGSWVIPQFAENIGDAFDWWAVPAPCGPAGCTGMPGGAGVVALKTTEHPEEVGKLMDFLASEESLEEFYARNLFIPGHLGLAEKGIEFETDDPRASHALSTFAAAVPGIADAAYQLQGYANNRVVFDALISRIGEAVVGELSVEDALNRAQEDAEQQIAEREREG